jgi:hypothetical protein
MEYTLYKTETFIVDVVLESGKRLLEQREIMEFLQSEGFLTQCGSAFETDLVNDVFDNLDWSKIKRDIKDGTCESDEENEETQTQSETEIESE